MELIDYMRILRRHWRVVLASALAGLLVALTYVLVRDEVYTADAAGFVATSRSSSAAEDSLNDTLAKSRATSYVDVAQSRGTAEAARKISGIDESAASLVGRISVTQPPDTVLIRVTAQGASPQEATDLANAWIAGLAQQVAEIEGGDDGLRVVPQESAALPTSPTSPNPRRDLPLGLALGLLVGLGLAVLRAQLDRRVRSAEDIKPFDLAVMATVPQSRALARRTHDRIPALTGAASRSNDPAASEALRKLRTNLRYMDVDNPPRAVVISSPREGDGKSTIAVNLAYALAASGQPTTLIDADLRRPVIAEGVGLVGGAGLTDVLVGEAEVDEVLQEAPEAPLLQVLTAGNIPPNPSEVLGSRAMATLLAELSERGRVVIDVPPLLPVTDGAILTAMADGVILVVSAGKTLDTHIERTLEHLAEVNGRVLGVVVNRATRKETSSYYGGETSYYL